MKIHPTFRAASQAPQARYFPVSSLSNCPIGERAEIDPVDITLNLRLERKCYLLLKEQIERARKIKVSLGPSVITADVTCYTKLWYRRKAGIDVKVQLDYRPILQMKIAGDPDT